MNSRLKSIFRTGELCRRTASSLLFFLVTLLLAASSSSAQQPVVSQQSALSKPGTEATRRGTITGRVLSDDGHPLANATVFAFAFNATGPPTGDTTDAEGKFEVKNLRPGAYRVQVSVPGYVLVPDAGVEFGSTRFYRIGETANLTMVKGGVITGTVTDASGEPVIAATVRAVRVRKPTERPANSFSFSTPRMTDDRGIYRLYGLEPGVYVIATGGSGQYFGNINAYDGDAPTYYPSTTRDAAAELTVHAGEELTGIDVRYRGERGHIVSGFVSGSIGDAGTRFGGVSVTLSLVSDSLVGSGTYLSGEDNNRSFALNGIADGEYLLIAMRGVSVSGEALMATRRISVRGGDVTGMELKLEPLGALTGNVTLEPPPKADCRSQRNSNVEEIVITARRLDKEKEDNSALPFFLRRIPAAPNEKGEFKLYNLRAGSLRLDLQLPGDDWYVRSIALPGAATTSARTAAAQSKIAPPGTFTLKAGERIAGITVTIGQGAAGLRGRVAPATEGTTRPSGLRVHLVPVEPERAADVLRYMEATVESDGQFTLGGIAPGRYWIIARSAAANESESEERPPVALTTTERDKLRREAESAGVKIELQPCQRLADYVLNYAPTPPKQSPVK